jgi:transposase
MSATATTPPTAGPILAIDLGRYKSVACTYDPATRAAAFRTLDTGREEFARLFARHPAALVVVEACANAGWAADLAAECGLAVKVANTSGEAWRFQHLKRKTDRDDARRLAELEALGQLPTVTLPDPATRQRRGLIAHRQALVGRRVAAQNRIRSLFAAQGLPAPRGHRAWTETGLAGLDLQAKPLAECAPDELWRGMLHLALADHRHLLGQLAAA